MAVLLDHPLSHGGPAVPTAERRGCRESPGAILVDVADRLRIEPLESRRLTLDPLGVVHSQEMAPILADPSIYDFIDGPPLTPAQVRSRYERLEAGSPDPSVKWLNWVIRCQAQRALVGSLQATVWPDQGQAEVAWIVGTAWQGQGIATEAAGTVVRWLQRQGIRAVIAHIHPDHGASQAVARRIGLQPTAKVVEDEIEWRAELA